MILRITGAAAALLLTSAASPAPDAAPVIAAERAFAAEAQSLGPAAAFRHYADAESLIFTPDPVKAKPLLDAGAGPQGNLRWWPVYAGIAASGELGFSTGPFVGGPEGRPQFHGWFFTIWSRQPDGSWRWLLDHGTPTRDAAPVGPDTPVSALPAGQGSGSPPAFEDVAAAERALAARLLADAPAAYASVLAEDGRLMRVGRQPAVGRAAWTAAVASGPKRIAVWPLGGRASRAGDLAYTYGDAAWEEAGAKVRGHYVRLWQHRDKGWRLVVDELVRIPRPPPPPRR